MNSLTKCSVCTEPGTCENPITNCNGCGLMVHILCYGTSGNDDNLNLDKWKCSPCQQGIKELIICELCEQFNGAFKQSVCGKWVHLICALFTDGVRFKDPMRFEPIDIAKIINSKSQKQCVFCLKTTGCCVRCSKTRCKNPIHVTCAQAQNCLQVTTNEKNDSSIKFRAFCNDHKPKDFENHLSSQTIQKMLIKKTKRDREKSCTKIQMDGVEKLATEATVTTTATTDGVAFDIESTESSEGKGWKKAQQILKQKRIVDEMASTSKTTTPKPSFSQFDADDGRRMSVTSDNGSYSSLWWDTSGEGLEISLGSENDSHKDGGTAKTEVIHPNGVEGTTQPNKQASTTTSSDASPFDRLYINAHIFIVFTIFLLFTVYLIYSFFSS